MWCLAESSNPPSHLEWEQNGIPVPIEYIEVKQTPGEFKGTKVKSVIKMAAERNRNRQVVTCTPRFDGRLIENMSLHYMLNITCKGMNDLIKHTIK